MENKPDILPNTAVKIQLSPFGEYIKRHPDGTQTRQVCDQTAFRRVLADWEARGRQNILMDLDHDKAHTVAAAWIAALEIDPVEGLVGEAYYTPAGAKLVNEKEYRFLSPDWDISDDDGRPFCLRTVGMTNRPVIPVRPILNSNEAELAPALAEGPTQTKPGVKPKMDKIAEALGLDPTATEADVIAAIAALTAKVKAAEEAKLETEAKSVAAENATRIENSEAFIAAYKVNPAAVKAALATLKAVASPRVTRVTNSEDATAPAMGGARKFAGKAEARKALAEQPVGKRQAFYHEHQAEIEG